MLTRPYTKSNFDLVINSMGSLKAPGPDGFQSLFNQKNWNLVAPKVYDMVLSALEGKGLPPTLMKHFLSSFQKLITQNFLLNFDILGYVMSPTNSSLRRL